MITYTVEPIQRKDKSKGKRMPCRSVRHPLRKTNIKKITGIHRRRNKKVQEWPDCLT